MKMYRPILVAQIILFTLSLSLFADIAEDIRFITDLYRDGLYDVALKEITKIEPRLQRDSDSSQIRLIKADIYIKQGKHTDARDILNSLDSQSLSPSLQAQVLLSLAMLEREQNNFSRSEELINQFIRKFPDDPKIVEVYQLLGDIHFQQGDFAKAESVYRELHRQHLSSVTYVNIVKIQATNGDMASATQTLQQLQSRYPSAHTEYQHALLLLCTAYENEAQYQQIIDLCPDIITPKTVYSEQIILKKVAAYIYLKRFDEATALLSQVKENPAIINYYRALIHKEKGEYQLALPLFQVLADSKSDQNLRAMSFFQIIQITARTDTPKAYQQLQDYLVAHPDQPWEGDIMYQLAQIDYQNQRYESAYTHVLRALNLKLNTANYQNALYLKGELEFLQKKYRGAIQTFSENNAKMPRQYADEILFKQGASFYWLTEPDSARVYFLRLISDYPSSQKVGFSYYHLGEIELFKNTTTARSYYMQALSGDMDAGVVNLRLAYLEQMREDYPRALERLNLVPETTDYLYDKNLLKGNILFAQKKYADALTAYRVAERNSPDRQSAEYVLARQAWTYYNMQDYNTATQIYRRLAEQSSAPGQYLLSAAGSAFNADNFEDSASLYKEYIDTYPTSPERYKAMVGLANCYFNLGNFEFAIDIWRELVHQDRALNIVESSLKGLQSSYQKLGQVPLFTEFLNLQILRSNKKDFVILLYEYKVNFEYDQKNYSASVNTLNQLFLQYPETKNDPKLMILLANNYTWLTQYEEADQIYVELTMTHKDPSIYHEWAKIKWLQADYPAAIIRYKRAANDSQNEQYWLVLLERQLQVKDSEFMQYYGSFIGWASEYSRAIAKGYLIDWQINEKNYTGAMATIEEILTTSYPLLRATATFKRGEIYFAQKNYDDALTDFLRIRYVFSEYSEIRYKSELYVAKIYHHQGEIDRSRSLFESIKEFLTAEQVKEYEGLR